EQRGLERVFVSPVLELGQLFSYTVRATWMENGVEVNRVRTLKVEAGRQYLIDFTRPPTEEVSSPPATTIAPEPSGRELRSTTPLRDEVDRDRANRNPGWPFR